MTLIESVVAFVLLAVVGVACLDLSRGATGLETRSVEWTRAVAVGDAVLDGAAAGIGPVEVDAMVNDASALQAPTRVEREPWSKGAGVDVVTVIVTLPGGTRYRASRLVSTGQRGNTTRAVGVVR
ncbi:MAG TPA: hypothetical protein VE869_14120 [Gemmatimonas sp.]|nr:hypothetical protein [Gemmatimonas sp.]